MKITQEARFFFVVGSAWLIISGISGMATTSQGNKYGGWFEEDSLLALSQRGQGSLQIGLGLGLMGAACLSTASVSESRSARPSNAKTFPTGKEQQQENYSDKTSEKVMEDDFISCVKLYRQRDGADAPLMSKSWQVNDELTLKNSAEKILADFKKNKSGNWYLTAKYR
ncbi:MAG: Uncharacterised protein [Prochlorococcus marinus str. MIT 9215]|nr:MAG: Uncharacterised protein [Prochlorococcus marinus str. MIT 9215]